MKPNPLMIVFAVLAVSLFGRAIHFAGAAAESLNARADGTAAGALSVEDLVAEKTETAPAEPTIALAGEAEPANPPALKPAPVEDFSTPETPAPAGDESTLLAKIRARSATLDQREAELADRARLLEVVERRVDEKTVALKTVKEELESRLSFADTAAKDDIARLAKMYENMKPQRAGEIFNAMDPTFAAGFLTEMNNEAAALILANMETNKAYAASVIIAGRNANINHR